MQAPLGKKARQRKSRRQPGCKVRGKRFSFHDTSARPPNRKNLYYQTICTSFCIRLLVFGDIIFANLYFHALTVACISLLLRAFNCFWMHMIARICLYLHALAYLCMRLLAFVCMCMLLHVYACICLLVVLLDCSCLHALALASVCWRSHLLVVRFFSLHIR